MGPPNQQSHPNDLFCVVLWLNLQLAAQPGTPRQGRTWQAELPAVLVAGGGVQAAAQPAFRVHGPLPPAGRRRHLSCRSWCCCDLLGPITRRFALLMLLCWSCSSGRWCSLRSGADEARCWRCRRCCCCKWRGRLGAGGQALPAAAASGCPAAAARLADRICRIPTAPCGSRLLLVAPGRQAEPQRLLYHCLWVTFPGRHPSLVGCLDSGGLQRHSPRVREAAGRVRDSQVGLGLAALNAICILDDAAAQRGASWRAPLQQLLQVRKGVLVCGIVLRCLAQHPLQHRMQRLSVAPGDLRLVAARSRWARGAARVSGQPGHAPAPQFSLCRTARAARFARREPPRPSPYAGDQPLQATHKKAQPLRLARASAGWQVGQAQQPVPAAARLRLLRLTGGASPRVHLRGNAQGGTGRWRHVAKRNSGGAMAVHNRSHGLSASSIPAHPQPLRVSGGPPHLLFRHFKAPVLAAVGHALHASHNLLVTVSREVGGVQDPAGGGTRTKANRWGAWRPGGRKGLDISNYCVKGGIKGGAGRLRQPGHAATQHAARQAA